MAAQDATKQTVIGPPGALVVADAAHVGPVGWIERSAPRPTGLPTADLDAIRVELAAIEDSLRRVEFRLREQEFALASDAHDAVFYVRRAVMVLAGDHRLIGGPHAKE